MRTVFTKIFALIITASLLLSLASCHGRKSLSPFEIPEEFDVNEEYEITFWAKNDNNKYQQQIYKNAVENFQKTYPNIKVNMRMFSDYNEIYKNVITNIQTGTTPNVCISYPDHIATYNTGEDVVIKLDALLEDEVFGLGGTEIKFDAPTKDEMISSFLEEGKIGDSYYALPFMRSSEVCYINRDLVEKLGYTLPEKLTWDFIWEVSEAALEKNEDGTYKINGQSVMIPFIYKSTDNMMIQYLKQSEAGYSTSDGKVLIFNDTTESFLKEIATHTASGAFSTFKVSSYPGNYLNAGQCIFAIDSTAGATWMGTNAPNLDISNENLVPFDIEVMALPQLDHENPKMISQGPSVCIFNKDDNGEVLASWIFAQYLLTNEVQIAYSSTEGYVPVTEKAKNSAEFIDYLSRAGENNNEYYEVKVKATKILMDNTENTFVTPVFNGSASLRNASGQLIENVVNSVRRGEEFPDTYFDKLYNDVSSLYHLDEVGLVVNDEDGFSRNLGPLPKASVILIVALSVIWIVLISYFIYTKMKIRKKTR